MEWDPANAAEGFSVGEYLLDWLKAWLAEQMERIGGTYELNQCLVDFLLMDPPDPRIRLDPNTANKLEWVTDVSAETWLNIDAAYRRWREGQEGVLVDDGDSPLGPCVATVATWWAPRGWTESVTTEEGE